MNKNRLPFRSASFLTGLCLGVALTAAFWTIHRKDVLATAHSQKLRGGEYSRYTWPILVNDDFAGYAGALRACGLDEGIVRLIVSGAIFNRFEGLIATTRTDRAVDRRRSTVLGLLRKRNMVLREVLGIELADADWMTDASKDTFNFLPKDKRILAATIDADYSDLVLNLRRRARSGVLLDREKKELEFLEGEKKKDLLAVLTQEEYDEYMLKSSPQGVLLTSSLGSFALTATESRLLLGIQQTQRPPGNFSNIPSYLPVGDDVKSILGEQKYSEYLKQADRDRAAMENVVSRLSLPESVTDDMMALRGNFDAIMKLPNGGTKRTQIIETAAETKATLSAQLGDDGYRAVLQGSPWLKTLEAISKAQAGKAVQNSK